MPIPQALADFDIANATVTIWLFKKSRGAHGPTYTGRWIDSNAELDTALKVAVAEARNGILEVNEYGLLAANGDGLALRIDALETHAGLIIDRAAAATAEKKASTLKQVENIAFYSVKLTSNDQVLHAVRKADSSWKSKTVRGLIQVLFADEQLGLSTSPEFNISRYVDFFIINDDVIIKDKLHFESVLEYKQAHAADFAELQVDPAFVAIFSAMEPLTAYIGTNKLHLRRACAIRQKGHYNDVGFMNRLRQHYVQCGLNLVFDEAGRISATPETCADIMRALLDHRLTSVFSENMYNVQDATAV